MIFGENMEEAIFLEGDAVSFIYLFLEMKKVI